MESRGERIPNGTDHQSVYRQGYRPMNNEKYADKSDYIWKGDTWGPAGKDCPECSGDLYSNGKIHDCNDCEFWKVIGKDFDSESGSDAAWKKHRDKVMKSLGVEAE